MGEKGALWRRRGEEEEAWELVLVPLRALYETVRGEGVVDRMGWFSRCFWGEIRAEERSSGEGVRPRAAKCFWNEAGNWGRGGRGPRPPACWPSPAVALVYDESEDAVERNEFWWAAGCLGRGRGSGVDAQSEGG